MTFQNVMSVNVPVYQFKTRSDDAGEIYPYGFATTSGELDGAVEALSGVFQDMLKLAEIEKGPPSCWPRRSKRPAAGSTPWNT